MPDITFTATVKKVYFEKNGFYIFRAEPHTVKGTPPFQIVEGQRYKIAGNYVTNPKYGKQVEMVACEHVIKNDRNGIVEYLIGQKIKGVGRKLAETIYEKFRENTLDVLDNHPEMLRSVNGIGDMKYEAIRSAWKENREAAKIVSSMADQGISYSQAVKIYRCYGEDSFNIIRENPYRLIKEIDGFGFKTADNIAIKVGVKWDSPMRICAGFSHVLDESSAEGHCYLPTNDLIKRTVKILQVNEELVKQEIQNAINAGDIIREDDNCWKPEMLEMEKNVARRLIRLMNVVPEKFSDEEIEDVLDNDTSIEYEASQIEAIKGAVNNSVFILTGGPGTGKSTVSKAILDILDRSDYITLLASPTGRAAKRLSETTGREAMTIHRLLKYNPGMGFQCNAFNKLECDAVLIDEASMIDIALMDKLLDAIPDGAKVIFVGDADQLPSVGAGNVFRDMIESGSIPVGKLTMIHRQKAGSNIIELAHAVNHGEPLKSDFAEGSKDVTFISLRENKAIADEAVKKTKEFVVKNNVSLNDFQILSPTKKPQYCGMFALNERLQQELNPDGTPIPRTNFRVGDKVMQLKNNYEKDVFNGDIGFIVGYDNDEQTFSVRFNDGDKDKVVTYEWVDGDQLQLAYVCTVHKAQGAEYQYVVLIFTDLYYKMKTRNLLYTAITRCSKDLYILGNLRDLNDAVANNRIDPRYTSLCSRLK